MVEVAKNDFMVQRSGAKGTHRADSNYIPKNFLKFSFDAASSTNELL